MAKKRNSRGTPEGGFVNKLIRPWKKQRISLTRAGKKVAPMRKGKASKKQEESTPNTARQRQIQELKTLANIGKRDPERLAGIISRMLMEADMKDEEARLRFERLIWEKAEKRKPDKEEGEDS